MRLSDEPGPAGLAESVWTVPGRLVAAGTVTVAGGDVAAAAEASGYDKARVELMVALSELDYTFVLPVWARYNEIINPRAWPEEFALDYDKYWNLFSKVDESILRA